MLKALLFLSLFFLSLSLMSISLCVCSVQVINVLAYTFRLQLTYPPCVFIVTLTLDYPKQPNRTCPAQPLHWRRRLWGSIKPVSSLFNSHTLGDPSHFNKSNSLSIHFQFTFNSRRMFFRYLTLSLRSVLCNGICVLCLSVFRHIFEYIQR